MNHLPRRDPEGLIHVCLGVVGFTLGVSSLLTSGETLPLLMVYAYLSIGTIAYFVGREHGSKQEKT